MKINNFQGDLTDMSAKKEALLLAFRSHATSDVTLRRPWKPRDRFLSCSGSRGAPRMCRLQNRRVCRTRHQHDQRHVVPVHRQHQGKQRRCTRARHRPRSSQWSTGPRWRLRTAHIHANLPSVHAARVRHPVHAQSATPFPTAFLIIR